MTKPFSNYKREGKRLVPPIKQIKWLVETSFIKEKIPEFCWISSLLLQLPGNEGPTLAINFIRACEEILGKQNTKPLVFLSNFLLLTSGQKEELKSNPKLKAITAILRECLQHHLNLINGYPLSFIVSHEATFNRRGPQIGKLKSDINGLLDRTSLHATKVQAVSALALVLTDRMHLGRNGDIPDITRLFETPSSDEVARIGAFVRSAVTADHGFSVDTNIAKEWKTSFWQQCYDLSPCS